MILFAFFEQFGRNEIKEKIEQKLKTFIPLQSFTWIRMYIKENSMPLFNFVDWVGSP